ncbi:tetratricopeptide repeat protein [Streptomyces virginiae]|uniref:tetratricopeptide repeat protein n=1 Tax=Streptomyces virginiae TaxID=1961 RepID=UPI003702FEEC
MTLLPPAEGARAAAELSTTGLAAAAVPFLPVVCEKNRGSDALPAGQMIVALRTARTVLDCDALLDAAPVNWDVVAAAHAREPFSSTPSRALIARRDCPEALTVALLTPWRLEVADRLAARQKARPVPRVNRPPGRQWAHPPRMPRYELPDAVRDLLTPRLSDLRTPLLRLMLTEGRTREVVCATTRLDRLLAAVDYGDSGHTEKLYAFWDTVGAELRTALGEDRKAWMTAAERLPWHKGSLHGLLDGLDEPTPNSQRRPPDLRVLVQAPPRLLAAIIADLDDESLEQAADACTGPRGVRMGRALLATALSKLEAAGVPPRRLFARWARISLDSWNPGSRNLAAAGWLYGLDEELDEGLVRLTHTHDVLRRRLTAAQPQRPPAKDLVAELRANPGPVQAQLILDISCAEDTPWTQLVEAHTAEPLPDSVLWVLAARPGFPAALTPSISPNRLSGELSDLAVQGPDAARVALARLSDFQPTLNERHYNAARWTIQAVRSARMLDDPTVLATVQPAGAVLLYGRDLSPDAPDRDSWNKLCSELLTAAASRFGPGFWRVLASRLPTFEGTLPELLAPGPGDAITASLHAFAENGAASAEAGLVRALLDRYETQVLAAVACLRDETGTLSVPAFPDRQAALRWLDAELDTLLAVARVASTVRPGLTISLPRLLDRYLNSRGRIAELIPLAELARQTAARVGDRHGEAVAWAAIGSALTGLRRYDEAVAVNERARALMSATGDLEREGRISNNLGNALRTLRRYREAVAAHEDARALFRRAGLPVREGAVCRDLGRTLNHAGRTAEAAAAFREAITLFEATGHDSEISETESDLSRLTERMAMPRE